MENKFKGRKGDKVTTVRIKHGSVVDVIETHRGYDCAILPEGENIGFTVHGHLDLEDIQKYIESKEQKPVRKATKYINIWISKNGFTECRLRCGNNRCSFLR